MEKIIAKDLLSIRAVFFRPEEPFTWASGIKSPNPATMPVATDPNPALTVNEAVAEEIGFTIPQAILDRATGAQTQKVTRVESAIVSDGADYEVGILQLLPHVALAIICSSYPMTYVWTARLLKGASSSVEMSLIPDSDM